MWARVVEFMLACWLAISPFIFRYPGNERFFWINDYICAFLIGLFAFLSFWHPLRKIHLLSIGVGLWLIKVGYQTFPQLASAPEENAMSIGILILMLAIVPSHSHMPPHSWQVFEDSTK